MKLWVLNLWSNYKWTQKIFFCFTEIEPEELHKNFLLTKNSWLNLTENFIFFQIMYLKTLYFQVKNKKLTHNQNVRLYNNNYIQRIMIMRINTATLNQIKSNTRLWRTFHQVEVHHSPLLHLQQSHFGWLRKRFSQYQLRKNFLYLCDAYRMLVYVIIFFFIWLLNFECA